MARRPRLSFAVYVITHLASGKRYVGESCDVDRRWRQHRAAARGGRASYLLHRAIAKYGVDAFSFEVVSRHSTEAEAIAEEARLIRLWRTTDPALGYNLTEGGTLRGGANPSAATRAKISAAHRGRKYGPEVRARMSAAMRGKKRSPEARAAMSARRTGTKLPEETREKMRAAWVRRRAEGKVPTPEQIEKLQAGRRSAVVSEETREKMRAAHLGRTFSKETCEKIAAARRNLSPEKKAARAEKFRATMAAKRSSS